MPLRRGLTRFRELPREEQDRLISQDPRYGHVICRCETVTEAEVADAILRQVGARDLDGVKRRTRAGTGRCQGGFCTPRVVQVLARELGVPPEQITKDGPGSELFAGVKGGEDPRAAKRGQEGVIPNAKEAF